jgi:two-component system alkaline phosphatase synthesis response regulator PhoP
MEVRPAELQVLIDGRRVGLTVREFQTFECLVRKADRVHDARAHLRVRVGRPMPRRDRSVDVFIRKIRGKLDACAPGVEYIHTHFGVGYRFSPVDAQPH